VIGTKLRIGATAAALAALLAATPGAGHAQTAAPAGTAAGGEIGGVVTGPNGPEAGVWVIAETTDLPTKFAKIVVTDEAGRYLIPDLPPASYRVWVRGYGLVDSARVEGRPGQRLDLAATPAGSAAAAAEYYPGVYWYSMLRIPAADQFPRHRRRAGRQRHPAGDARPARLGGCGEADLPVLPRAGQPEHPPPERGVGRVRQFLRPSGCAASSPARR
jgi:hypothetical protein